MTNEIGHARGVTNRAIEEDNWDLKFPQSARIYAKMGREDTQIKSVLKAVTLPIRRATWFIEPNGAPDEIVAHVSQDLRLHVKGEDPATPLASRNGRVSWDKHLADALKALKYGHMFFEQVYAPGADGREHLVKLAPRWPGSITKLNVAEDGGLDSIEQTGYGKKTNIVIPIDHLVAYAFEDEGAQWTGESLLRSAYKHWTLRDELLRIELNALDRNGHGVPVYTGSEFADDPNDDLRRGQEIAEGLRGGRHSGAAIPRGASLALMGVSGQIRDPRAAITYHDSMIAKSVLAHFLNLEGKGGSYALAETQSDLFIQSLQTTALWIADVATQHIVEDLVKVAFPEYSGLMPRISFDPIASKKELGAADLAGLVNAKIILPDKALEEDTRRRYTLPSKQSVSEALAAKKARLEMEQEAGIKLVDDDTPADTSEEINDLTSTVETNARYRTAMDNSQKLYQFMDSRIGELRGAQ